MRSVRGGVLRSTPNARPIEHRRQLDALCACRLKAFPLLCESPEIEAGGWYGTRENSGPRQSSPRRQDECGADAQARSPASVKRSCQRHGIRTGHEETPRLSGRETPALLNGCDGLHSSARKATQANDERHDEHERDADRKRMPAGTPSRYADSGPNTRHGRGRHFVGWAAELGADASSSDNARIVKGLDPSALLLTMTNSTLPAARQACESRTMSARMRGCGSTSLSNGSSERLRSS